MKNKPSIDDSGLISDFLNHPFSVTIDAFYIIAQLEKRCELPESVENALIEVINEMNSR